MYSLMSRRIIEASEPKNFLHKILQSSVFPTPVGPQNMKPAMGRTGLRSPARARRSARETAFTASSWPTMPRCNSSSNLMSRADSEEPTCSTAMPVQPATTAATSASVTFRCNICVAWSEKPPVTLSKLSKTSFLRSFNLMASSKFSADTASKICACNACNSSMCSDTAFPVRLDPCSISKRVDSSSSRTFNCCAKSYFSAATAFFFSCLIVSRSCFVAQRSAEVSLSNRPWKSSWRTLEPASSITSIALSGKKRSEMY
mmetsp:Transcript_154270/g.494718  ORF Transcript_154270/g.494718 Transcript_154270/m.494718 type:complete len:259 (+) Transcript_154270:1368-2144(+)